MRNKLIVATLSLSMGLALSSCIPQSLKEQREITKSAVQEDDSISTPRYMDTDAFRLHYRSAGTATLGVVVWVHGTPGGWDDGIRLMVDKGFISDVQILGIDRPGWGQSQYLENPRLVSSFEETAELMSPLLTRLKTENPDLPVILVGHSWGGSVVPAIALKYPELVDGIIIAAGGLDPDLTGPRWYNRMGNTWVARAFIGEGMRAANIEVYALRGQLSQFQSQWKDLTVPVVAIQGEEDGLVDPANLDFIEEHFSDPYILRLPDQGHLLQAERANLIGKCIRAMLSHQLQDCTE